MLDVKMPRVADEHGDGWTVGDDGERYCAIGPWRTSAVEAQTDAAEASRSGSILARLDTAATNADWRIVDEVRHELRELGVAKSGGVRDALAETAEGSAAPEAAPAPGSPSWEEYRRGVTVIRSGLGLPPRRRLASSVDLDGALALADAIERNGAEDAFDLELHLEQTRRAASLIRTFVEDALRVAKRNGPDSGPAATPNQFVRFIRYHVTEWSERFDHFAEAVIAERDARIHRDAVEACAKAIEADKDRVFATGCPSLGELCIYDVCATTVRELASVSVGRKQEKKT